MISLCFLYLYEGSWKAALGHAGVCFCSWKLGLHGAAHVIPTRKPLYISLAILNKWMSDFSYLQNTSVLHSTSLGEVVMKQTFCLKMMVAEKTETYTLFIENFIAWLNIPKELIEKQVNSLRVDKVDRYYTVRNIGSFLHNRHNHMTGKHLFMWAIKNKTTQSKWP